MPVALDFGGMPVNSGDLQAGVEDYSASMSAAFDQEHDHQGLHTVPFQELEVTGDATLNGAVSVGDDFLASTTTEVTLTANTNNLALSDGRAISTLTIRLQAGSAYELTGLVHPSEAQHFRVLENGGAATITIAHNDSGSLAANRFSCPGSVDYELLSGAIAFAKYDPSSEVWRLLTNGATTMIASVQAGTIAFTNGGSDSPTATISSVDTTKAFVVYNGFISDNAVAVHGLGVQLTNATTVTGRRASANNTATITQYFTVVEYT